MPFQSKAQQAYLFIHHPKLAHDWAAKYGVPKNLPAHKSEGRKKVSEALMARRRG